ncbi:DUF2470 domain-containing protein [Kitasatospora sp. NPDC096147]|uniref:DUF2470 domain-containing protein n=1 Tax=Kitasatospora sp. NPDC096147 TaxID=3364093 RepID=UPI00381FF99C
MPASPAQPSHGPDSLAPTPAERARTLLEFASSVVVDVPGMDLAHRPGIPPLARCAVLADGSLAVLVEQDTPLCRIVSVSRGSRTEGLAAVLEAVDVAPVAMPHRIRGRATVHGQLDVLTAAAPEVLDGLFPQRPTGVGYALLRLTPDHLSVEDLWGSECCVPLTDLGPAAPDPLAADEAAMLQHLAAAHPDHLARLGSLALDQPTGPAGWQDHPHGLEVRPVALDRFGLRVRMIDGERILDARFEFHRPVTSADQLPEAMHRLFRPADSRRADA